MISPSSTVGRTAILLVAGLLWACDLPTEAPKLEQKWFVPLAGTSVQVGELLPADVGFNQDSSAFTVSIEAIAFQDSLGALCPGCAGLDGLTVPKPAFVGEFSEDVSLPGDVESVQVAQGTVVVEAVNQFSFDTLRPPGGDRGVFTLAIRDGGPSGPILDQVIVDGEDTAFGPGTTLTRELEYSGPVSSVISVTVTVDSPAGGPEPGNWVQINLDDQVRVTATPEDVEAESAVVDVGGTVFDFGTTELDVEDVSQEIVDHVVSGSFVMDIVNPWSVGGTLNLSIVGPTLSEPIVLIASVPPSPTATVEVEFTREELQAFLGQPNVVVIGQGTVNQSAGAVTLTPDQTMTVDTDLDITILVG